MSFLIRQVKPEDAPQLKDLLKQVSSSKTLDKITEDSISRAIRAQAAARLIAQMDNGDLGGYGELYMLHTLTDGITGRFENIVTHNEYRRQGVSRKICERLIALARVHHVTRIELRSSNPSARKLYIEFGFSIKETSRVMLLKL